MAIRPADHGIFAASGAAGAAFGAYWMGGRYGSPDTDVIDFTNFVDDATAALSAVVGYGTGVYGAGGCSNNGTAGYVGGGWSIDDIYKITYATDATSSVSDTLAQASYVAALSGCADSPTNGYWFGGYGGSMWGDATIISKIVFSSEAVAAISATIVGDAGSGSYGNSAASNNGTAAIVADGAGGNGSTDSITKLTYSGETTALSAATMSAKANKSAAHSNSGTAGYFHLGEYPKVNAINKYTYATDATSTLVATSSFVGEARCGGANSGTAGYSAGGENGGNVDTIDKLVYSSDAVSTITPTLSNARQLIPNTVANCETL